MAGGGDQETCQAGGAARPGGEDKQKAFKTRAQHSGPDLVADWFILLSVQATSADSFDITFSLSPSPCCFFCFFLSGISKYFLSCYRPETKIIHF